MNRYVKVYLQKYGIADDPDMSESNREKLKGDYFYIIINNLQGWYIKERPPSDEIEDLVIAYLKKFPGY
jgi:hypothetical protein